MRFEKITEKDSHYDALETKSVKELLTGIHQQDQIAVSAVGLVLSKIEILVNKLVPQLKKGGRLFYIGAGTSGRLGVLDASECPPTFGTDPEMVKGLIAGGLDALHQSIENAEDDYLQGWNDLQENKIDQNDFVIGIAASGTTPYALGALEKCQKNGIVTGCITCNLNSPLIQFSDFPIEVVVGPEFVTGSSRMKAGTAQKLILNMITTSSMIQLGRIKGNKMIDVQMTNVKLVDRAVRILMEELDIDKRTAAKLLEEYKSIRAAIKNYA
ncbi:MAG: N-acetylmuramic acid 6-phosphate etherase [Flavobacteriaceae bacterium TMED212]|mgnify:CR=1 FL=1|nr:MAG: N-acetylmuramic acid 6-phosphate etherase [Flavobacteriaceae bacterium TMED212]|tara:strand:- start:2495 stop:3304 length:810 start_codon:yes stop_codon:yes gene_type:complete